MNLYEQIGEEKIDELVMHMYDDIIPMMIELIFYLMMVLIKSK